MNHQVFFAHSFLKCKHFVRSRQSNNAHPTHYDDERSYKQYKTIRMVGLSKPKMNPHEASIASSSSRVEELRKQACIFLSEREAG
jgi:hypothetical protein